VRVGIHLGPFYASTSLGGRRRPRRGSSSGLIGLCIQLMVWTLVATAVACYWMLKAMWIGGVWLAGQIGTSVKRRREAQAALLEAGRQRATCEHARLVASLKPEDVAFLRENGWRSPVPAPESAPQ
jgi:hypothetical protein